MQDAGLSLGIQPHPVKAELAKLGVTPIAVHAKGA